MAREQEMGSRLNIHIDGFRRCDPLNRYIVTSLGLSLLRNRGLAAKDILLDLAGGCFGSSDTKRIFCGALKCAR